MLELSAVEQRISQGILRQEDSKFLLEQLKAAFDDLDFLEKEVERARTGPDWAWFNALDSYVMDLEAQVSELEAAWAMDGN